MKVILFLTACLLAPTILTFAHQVWMLRRELRASGQAGGLLRDCVGAPSTLCCIATH
jgi:hypothetical protein